MAKAGIHPNYQLATITCACGAVYKALRRAARFRWKSAVAATRFTPASRSCSTPRVASIASTSATS